jgi:tight adherence protein C
MVLLAILAVALIGFSVAIVGTVALEPRSRKTGRIAQIDAYSYAGTGAVVTTKPVTPARKSLDDLAASLGDLVARRLLSVREAELQRELVAAGFFNVGPRRFVGYRVMLAIGLPVAALWLFGLLGASIGLLIALAVIFALIGWVGPNFYVHRRARHRLEAIDDLLPSLIDLLVVTLEAGVSFGAAMRMSADRLTGPLGEELRLMIQEQALGLSSLEALQNWLRRCDTQSVRSFVRAMVQGDRLGVSIGSILRNQALEMRARQKASVEQKAQKAPIKILFPLVFLIFPAMFVVILGPAMFSIVHALHS